MSRDHPARVLWLTKGLGRGGAERLIRLSTPHLNTGDFRAEVAYLLPHKDALVPELQADGVPVTCLGWRRGDPTWTLRLRRLVRERGYDLIHTHSPVPALAARVGLGRWRTPLVHTEHNVWQRYRWPTRVTNAATYGRNAAVLAVSQGVANSIRRPGWAPWVTMPVTETLHHGIDERLVRRGDEARAHARQILGLANDDMVLGTVANFTPKKNQASLLSAARMLAAGNPRLRLVLVGSGPLEGALRHQVDRDRLGDRVLFAGSRDDVQTILPAFDVFVLSSLHEGLSIALVEAMAAGLPCVATRVGGVGEVLEDGDQGFLVPARDTDALTTALAKLVDDARLRSQMGEAAVERARHFSIPAAVDRMRSLYAQVLNGAATT